MAKTANGSTISFGGTPIGEVRSIDFSDDANAIDSTNFGDSFHVFETGIPSVECTCEVMGNNTLTRGSTGAIAITWGDTESDSITSALISSISKSGAIDDVAVSSITFVPADS